MIPTKDYPIYQYVRDVDNRPVGVVAGCFEDKTPMLGFSLCGPRDQWNRELGRTIAKGRLRLVQALKDRWEDMLPAGTKETERLHMMAIMPYIEYMETRLERIQKAMGASNEHGRKA